MTFHARDLAQAWRVTAVMALACVIAACGGAAPASPAAPNGTLRLTVEGPDDVATPARVELRDASGIAYLPDQSLRVAGACSAPAPEWWSAGGLASAPPTGVTDPDSGLMQFYVASPIEVALPPGRYTVTVTKGLEYREVTSTFDVRTSGATDVVIALERWIDLPARGWFGGDAHLHIARPGRLLDELIASWMRAEDVHVATLLQSGTHGGRIESSPQGSFGAASVYQDGDTIVASGQENPRTWLLGHGIVLGADAYLDSIDDYLAYDTVWRAARAQGALLGYAHFQGPGIMLDAPDGFVDFLEVLQFDVANYDALYALWTLGFRVSPFAGTDHPCAPSGVPGSQRLYARVDGALSYHGWLEAIRAGRTFVSNGPAIDLAVDGAGIGSEVRLAQPGTVHVRARVDFDPVRDDVEALEIVRGGRVIAAAAPEPDAPGEIVIEADVDMVRPDWLAARARGVKIASRAGARIRESHAHTGAVHVVVDGVASQEPRARALASVVVSHLERLEGRVDDEGIDASGKLPEGWTGVTPEVLHTGQVHLLDRIADARAFWRKLAALAAR